MDVNAILDAAKAALGPKTSDRQLSRALGLVGPAVHQFRRGVNPSEETMAKLADLIGSDARELVLDLVMSKTRDARLLQVWESLRQNIVKGAAVIALCVGSAHVPHLGTSSEQTAMKSERLYIITNRWLVRLARKFRSTVARWDHDEQRATPRHRRPGRDDTRAFGTVVA